VKTRTRCTALCSLLAAGALAGCSSERNRLAEFRDDPSPEMVTMHQRSDDVANRITLIKDESRRMIYRDWLYMWYLDRPTRLRPSPSAW
jgi:hypothetical protein